mmetsp:Transcript_7331/g.9402  ORF Transcript_7331/g.9402 Transcript_7331/m.9402 type:complete len:96 (-) Transcript_7331:159-446(-)
MQGHHKESPRRTNATLTAVNAQCGFSQADADPFAFSIRDLDGEVTDDKSGVLFFFGGGGGIQDDDDDVSGAFMIIFSSLTVIANITVFHIASYVR